MEAHLQQRPGQGTRKTRGITTVQTRPRHAEGPAMCANLLGCPLQDRARVFPVKGARDALRNLEAVRSPLILTHMFPLCTLQLLMVLFDIALDAEQCRESRTRRRYCLLQFLHPHLRPSTAVQIRIRSFGTRRLTQRRPGLVTTVKDRPQQFQQLQFLVSRTLGPLFLSQGAGQQGGQNRQQVGGLMAIQGACNSCIGHQGGARYALRGQQAGCKHQLLGSVVQGENERSCRHGSYNR